MDTTNPVLKGALQYALDELDRRKRSDTYFNDPVAWAEYMLGATLWSKQKEVVESVQRNKNVAVKAGHGVGKSFLVALLICHWVDTRYPECFVASTAPSQAQIGAIVWREIRNFKALIEKRHKDGEIDHQLPGYITSLNEWKSDDGTMIGFGRRPPENKEESAVQGIHARYVLFVGDEACGLSAEMIDAGSNITSNDNSRRILIGNPTNPGSHFGHVFRQDTGAWALHTISVLDSPHFTDEGKTLPKSVMDNLTGPEYVEDKKKEYGEDSARYKARVLGEFAYDLGDALIKETDIAPARDVQVFLPDSYYTVLGCDIARMGKDSSVVYISEHGEVLDENGEYTGDSAQQLRLLESWDQARTTESANRIHRLAIDYNVNEVRVDGNGVGGGVIDVLMARDDVKYTVIDMNSNGNSPDRRKWHNARAYWWDTMRSLLRESQVSIDTADERLQDELMSLEYKYNAQSGGLLVESKDDLRKRGGKSPDFADAAIYACADMSHVVDPNPIDKLNPGDRLYADMDGITGGLDWWVEGI